MSIMTTSREAGWYEDPSGLHTLRFFDGEVWTTETRDEPAPAPAAAASAKSGWYSDPAGSDGLRFFDGTSWGAEVRPRETVHVPDPRVEAAIHAPVQALPDSTSVRLARRSLADIKRTDSVLAEGKVEKSSRRFSWVMVVAGVGLLLYGFYATVVTNWIGEQGQEDLREQYVAMTEDEPTAEPSTPVETAAPAPVAEPAAPVEPVFNRDPMPTLKEAGTPTGVIKIPSIGVDQVFVSGTKVPDLKKGPGIWEYGAFPGTPGNATISGHRTTYGGPFRNIDKLKVGDQIIVSVDGQPDAVFEVRGTIVVEPSRVQVTENTPGVRLTLTTCEPVGSDAERLVVQAELVSGAWADHAISADQWQIMS